MKKVLCFSLVAVLMLGSASLVWAEGAEIGGHFKFYLFDQSSGKSDGISDTAQQGMGWQSFYLYITKELSDKVSINIEPEWSASSRATPRLGTRIGEQRRAAGDVDVGLHGFAKAYIKALLPNGYELSAGLLRPLFTEGYGGELFFEEDMVGNKVSSSSYLGSWHDTGIELYKTFEFEKFSLPAYLYVLNGGYEFNDNNQNKAVLVHVTPQIGNLTLMGSYGTGTWDADNRHTMDRWSGGLSYKKDDFSLRSEFIGGSWEDKEFAALDAPMNVDASGYYAKAFYRFKPWLRAMLGYSLAKTPSSGGVDEEYRTLTPALHFFVADGSTLILQYDIADWKRKDGSAELEFNRLVLGWRTTF